MDGRRKHFRVLEKTVAQMMIRLQGKFSLVGLLRRYSVDI